MKTLYLDVDGVVSPFDKVNRYEEWEYRKKHVAGFRMTYSPNLISILNRVSQNVDIAWLTSWELQAATELAPALGLHRFRVLQRLYGDNEYNEDKWWKLNAIKMDYKDKQPEEFYWIDDDLILNENATEWAINNGGIPISPHSKSGISPTTARTLLEWSLT